MTGGMDPVELGERVLLGIQRNDAYILPHGEFKDEVQGLFDGSFPAFRKDKKSIRAERHSRTVAVRRPPRPKRR